MAEDVIPRPIRYRFLAVAQEVCDLARVDHWEHSEVLSSLREQMEASYRAYDEAGEYKDDAEAKALLDFGSAKQVARVHQDGIRGLWHRLLFNGRYTVHRLMAPVIFCMLHIFLKTTGGLEVTIFSSTDLAWKIPLFGWDFYIGVIVILVVGCTRFATTYLRVPKPLAGSIAFIFTVWLFSVLAAEWVGSMAHWQRTWNDFPSFDNRLAGLVELALYIIEAVTFSFVFAMAAAEILEVPAYHRAVVEAKRKRNLVSAGTWALWLDNCFKVLTGQTWNKMVWKTVR